LFPSYIYPNQQLWCAYFISKLMNSKTKIRVNKILYMSYYCIVFACWMLFLYFRKLLNDKFTAWHIITKLSLQQCFPEVFLEFNVRHNTHSLLQPFWTVTYILVLMGVRQLNAEVVNKLLFDTAYTQVLSPHPCWELFMMLQ
jgi:hypothetical protein